MADDPYVLDRLFHERGDEVAHTFRAYREFYPLVEITHHEETTSEFFAHVTNRKNFVIVAAYDESHRIFLYETTDGGFG